MISPPVSSCDRCRAVPAAFRSGWIPSAHMRGWFLLSRASRCPEACALVSPEGEVLSPRVESTQRRVQGPRSLKIPFHGDLMRVPLHSAHRIEWTLSRLLPPPGRDRSPGAPDGKAPHPGDGLGRGAECGRVWDPPLTKGPGAAGLIVQAPLKRGLSPPKAVTGGFSSPAGATEKDQSKETLRHGFAVPPPFSGEVFRGMAGRWGHRPLYRAYRPPTGAGAGTPPLQGRQTPQP